MSTTIDERIVKMQFDNKNFESNVSTSMSTLDKLKQSLKFDGASEGLANLNATAGKIDLGGLSNAVETVQAKFSALEVIGVTALMNITNSAVDAGKKLVASLSTDQINAGWDKYADKTSAVQTIMAATSKDFTDTGEQMEYVNGQLNKLNWFTDETSYSFLDMVSNIGKFTSNGVKLDTAVTAMEGISTWAAISGANVNEASRAMYNLSQALATGSVKLIDWKSIENANMATAEFKETVIDTALALGVLEKDEEGVLTTLEGNEVSVTNFNEALKDGWFNSDVLLEVLNKYGGFSDKLHDISEETGMTATELLQAVDIYKKTDDVWDNMSDAFEKTTGREYSFTQMAEDLAEFGISLDDINYMFKGAGGSAELFLEGIGEAAADGHEEDFLRKMSMSLEDLQAAFDHAAGGGYTLKQMADEAGISMMDMENAVTALSDSTFDLGNKSFRAAQEAKTFQEALDSVKDAVSTGWMNTFEIIFGNYEEAKKLWTRVANELWDVFAGGAEDRNDMLTEWAEAGGRATMLEGIENLWNGLLDVINNVKEAFHDIFPSMTADRLLEITEKFKEFTEKFKMSEETSENFKSTLRGLFSVFDILKQAVSAVFSGLKSLFDFLPGLGRSVLGITGNFGEWITNLAAAWKENDTFRTKIQKVVDVLKQIPAVLNGIFTELTGMSLGEAFEKLTAKLGEFIDFLKTIPGAVDGVFTKLTGSSIGDTFKGFGDTISGVWNNFYKKGMGITDVTKNFKELDSETRGLWYSTETMTKSLQKMFNDPNESIDSFIHKFESLGISADVVSMRLLDCTGDAELFMESLWEASDSGVMLTDVFEAANATLPQLREAFDSAKQSADAFGDSEIISNPEENIGLLPKIFNGIKDALQKVGDFFKQFIPDFNNTLDEAADEETVGGVQERFHPLKALFEGLKSIFSGLWEFLKKMTPVFLALAEKVGEALDYLGKAISDAVENTDFDALLDLVTGGTIAGIGIGIMDFFNKLTGLTDGAGGILDGITGILDGVKGCFEAWQQDIKSNVLLKIAAAVAILTASLIALTAIDGEKLDSALLSVSIMLGELVLSMEKLSTAMSAVQTKKLTQTATAMLVMSAAVLILTQAVKQIAELDWDGVIKGLVGVGILCWELTESAKSLSQSATKLTKVGVGLIAFATAILILAQAVKQLSELSLEQLAKGLGGVGILCLELALFLKLSDFKDFGVGKGVGIIALAAAILILAEAVEKFAALDSNKMVQGLEGVGIVLAELALFLNLTGNAQKVVTTAAGMVILGAAMLIFAEATKKMGELQLDVIEKGLLGMAGVMLIMATALNFMPTTTPIIAAGMVIMAQAIIMISEAMLVFGSMSWEEIGKSIVALAGSMLILAAAAIVMEGTLAGAAAMIVMATAVAILSPVLQALGELSLEQIGLALLTLAGAFAVIGVAGLLLEPAIPGMLGLGAAITLIGIGAAACGVGLLAVATALGVLSASGTAAITMIVIAIEAILSLIPQILTKVGEGLVALFVAIGKAAPELAQTVKAVVEAIIVVLVETIPPLVEAIVTMIDEVLKTLAEHMPSIIQSGIDIVIAFLKGIRDNIGEIVEIVIDIIVELIEAIARKIPDLIQAGIDLIIGLIDGLAQGIEDNAERMRDAIAHLVESIIEAFLIFLGLDQGEAKEFIQMAKDSISSFISGLWEKATEVVTTIGKIIGDAIQSVTDTVKEWIQIGADLINGIVEGVWGAAQDAIDAVCGVAADIWDGVCGFFGIHSPSKEFAKIGRYLDEGLAEGLEDYSDSPIDASKNVAKGVSNAISRISDMVNNDIDASPTIRPVLDLDNVISGIHTMDDMLDSDRSIGLASTNSYDINRNIAESSRNNDLEEIKGILGESVSNNTITNTFNITGDNPREIAEEISHILQLQLERKDASWA